MATLKAPMAVNDGSVWLGLFNEYRVERWNIAERRREDVFERRVEWFPKWEEMTFGGLFTTRPIPRMSDVWYDAGKLWIKIAVADSRWPPKVSKKEIEESEHSPMLNWSDKVFDTVIEVLDARTGRLLASHRFDQLFSAFVGPGMMYSMKEAQDGTIQMVVWQLSYARSK